MVLRSLVWVWLLCLALPCRHSIRSLPAKARKEATNEVCMHHEKGQEGRKWIGSGCERKFDLISIRESIGVGVPALSNFPQEQSKKSMEQIITVKRCGIGIGAEQDFWV